MSPNKIKPSVFSIVVNALTDLMVDIISVLIKNVPDEVIYHGTTGASECRRALFVL